MKQYSYFLFPVFFIVLGVLAIGLSVYSLIFSIDYASLDEEYYTLIGALGFFLIGIVFLTFRGYIKVDKEQMQIIKENKVFGFLLSRDIVKVPKKVTQILIQEKPKKARGYIQAAVGFTYMIQSSDLYFTSERGAVKIISTDHERAIKIAEILKEQLKLNYSIKRTTTASNR